LIVRANKLEIYITNAVLGSLYGIYICKYGFGNLGGFGDIEQELFRFKDDKRFPAAEVNEWLQTVRKWMKKIPGGNSLPSGNLIRQKTQAPNINQKRKAEKDTQVS